MEDSSSREGWVALLGRRDAPTDGVEDYCTYLGRALNGQGVELRRARVEWAERGWGDALRQLRQESAAWSGRWVLLQYTALGWSRRGFPFRALRVLRALRNGGARVAVVFHEHARQAESRKRWIDRARGASQDWVVRRLYRGAERCIFADPLEKISWLPNDDTKSVFIPIGANIPEMVREPERGTERVGETKAVAVFGVSEFPSSEREREVSDISRAVHVAAAAGVKLRIAFMGRGTAEAKAAIDQAFRDAKVEVSILGLLSAEEIAGNLRNSDAMLFVRGRIHSRRGSAIAGIVCGLPIVGYAGAAEGTPLAEAGLELVPYGDCNSLGEALGRVLTDANLRRSLRERSESARRAHFSWDAIAMAFVQALGPNSKRSV